MQRVIFSITSLLELQQQSVGHGDLGARVRRGLAGKVEGGARGEDELCNILEFMQFVFHSS